MFFNSDTTRLINLLLLKTYLECSWLGGKWSHMFYLVEIPNNQEAPILRQDSCYGSSLIWE
jgi:hypothetical protein